MKKQTIVMLDDTTKKLLDKYSQNHGLSRSSAIRLIVREFFIKKRGVS